MIDYKSLMPELQRISRQAGDFIAEESQRFSTENIEYKGINDMVSYVDKEAEKMLVKELSVLLPEAGYITEEGTATEKADTYNWVIDPLDGTTNFVHGLPVYAVSVALIANDRPVMGVIYEITRKECFSAYLDGGAYCNDKRIAVSPVKNVEESLLATGFPYYNFEEMKLYLATLDDFMQNSHGLRRMGSAAVDLAYVACGRFEGFFEYNLNPWDVAAGIIIVREAGGRVTDFNNEDNALFGREILAACEVHAAMQKVIANRWKK